MLAVAQSTYVVALLRLLEPALRTTAERRFVNNGEIHMPAFQPTIPESACITALKAAVLAEQRALKLDMYSVSARVQKLAPRVAGHPGASRNADRPPFKKLSAHATYAVKSRNAAAVRALMLPEDAPP